LVVFDYQGLVGWLSFERQFAKCQLRQSWIY
jgi:hypothetical protein